jgi:hypothetical protein
MAVSLECTAAIRTLPGGNAADDPEAVMATFLPGGLDLLSKVVAGTSGLDRPPCFRDLEPFREVLAEVGLDLEWSA